MIKNVLMFSLAAFFITFVVFANVIIRMPMGANPVELNIDFMRIALLSGGIFIGSVSNQIYDRYTVKQKIVANRSDFTIGLIASLLLTSTLFEKIVTIDDAQIIFFFAVQNGFFFTTLVEKIRKTRGET